MPDRMPDSRHRFIIESCDVRGQLVQLDTAWQEACARTAYPPSVRKVLGEAFVAATLLAGTIKFEGKLTLQIRGNGPVHLLVVQVTNEGSLRGLARWGSEPVDDSLRALFGDESLMTISIESNRSGEPYQGIVALEGASLSDALREYFQNSEQLRTELYLAVQDDCAAGLVLQTLPGDDSTGDPDGWRRAVTLAATVTVDELCGLSARSLLRRLFHEEQVRLFDGSALQFACSCSRQRTSDMLLGLGETEVQGIIAEQSEVEITCEFCDARYRYDAIDVETLFRGTQPPDAPAPTTRH